MSKSENSGDLPTPTKKVWIGWDNGIGNISAVWDDRPAEYCMTPIQKKLNYTKKAAYISRLDRAAMWELLLRWVDGALPILALERPMVNPGRFKATASALRIVEAQEIVLEDLGIPYFFMDSKEWQKAMLPSGVEKAKTKEASLQVAGRLFPHLRPLLKKDADSLLMAEYMRRNNR